MSQRSKSKKWSVIIRKEKGGSQKGNCDQCNIKSGGKIKKQAKKKDQWEIEEIGIYCTSGK